MKRRQPRSTRKDTLFPYTTLVRSEEAGIKTGDVILGFAGKDIADSRELARVVAQHPADSEAEMTLWRDGSEQTVEVVTGEQPAPEQMAEASGPSRDSSYQDRKSTRLNSSH